MHGLPCHKEASPVERYVTGPDGATPEGRSQQTNVMEKDRGSVGVLYLSPFIVLYVKQLEMHLL